MSNSNSVIFKGKRNGIVIVLDHSTPFEELLDTFIAKINSAKSFFW